MDSAQPDYQIEISYDGKTWKPMPPGYQQSGVIVERIGDVVVQNAGRERRVYYRAVARTKPPN